MVDVFEKHLSPEHELVEFDLAFNNIHDCIGCYNCLSKKEGYPCVIKDDMVKIFPYLLEADYVVFASPLYYFSFPSYLKSLIDRQMMFNGVYKEKYRNKKAMAFLTYGGDDSVYIEGLKKEYDMMLGYNGWENKGFVAIGGYSNPKTVNENKLETIRQIALSIK